MTSVTVVHRDGPVNLKWKTRRTHARTSANEALGSLDVCGFDVTTLNEHLEKRRPSCSRLNVEAEVAVPGRTVVRGRCRASQMHSCFG